MYFRSSICLAGSDFVLVRHAVVFLPDNKPMEVHVGPAHDGLQDFVELGEGDVAAHLNAAPDGRLRVGDGDFDLIYLGGL